MDKDLIHELGMKSIDGTVEFGTDWELTEVELEKFAALIAEECAKVCDDMMPYQQEWLELREAAKIIRAKFGIPSA